MPPPVFPETPPLPPAVTSGSKPILFVAGTSGTTVQWATPFFETSAKICQRLQCLGLGLGGDTEHWPSAQGFIRSRPLPFRQVLPQCLAIVHHGGIGTAAAAIEHAVPQLIIPRVFGQRWNTEWLRKLELCRMLEPKSYTPDEGSRALHELITNPKYKASAIEFARRYDSSHALNGVCDYLENPAVMGQIRFNALRPRERAAVQEGRLLGKAFFSAATSAAPSAKIS